MRIDADIRCGNPRNPREKNMSRRLRRKARKKTRKLTMPKKNISRDYVNMYKSPSAGIREICGEKEMSRRPLRQNQQ